MLELDRARAEIGGAVDGIGGLVTVGLLPSTCDLISSPLVSAVAANDPGIRMRISMGYAGTLQQWIAVETNAMSVQKSLVLGGHGLTTLPPVAFADELARKLVSAAPLCNPKITRTIVLALPANRAIGQHVRRAVVLLVGCAKDAVERGAWPEGRWLGP
ncbi:LysR substrate-binding domain-containing protein [Caenimonas soli]|uniref:LysR substrate-binding domain-containing protein n=1 Tax=Caenimonas soli TaxID=2735555 RepID=UPI00155600E9|nr:LysR substrate-binding domain-containing protein [Caenimonas soli]NPC55596.1 hypothetical protein [Caenimonas soli]